MAQTSVFSFIESLFSPALLSQIHRVLVGFAASAILIILGADSILDSVRRSGGECLNLREHDSGFPNSRLDV